MANTMVKISSVTVGVSGAATIDFTDIPQTFTDLKVVFSLRSDRADTFDYIKQTFNNSASGYSGRTIRGDGASVVSTNWSTSWNEPPMVNGNTSTTSVFSNGEMYVPNYTSSNNKSVSFDMLNENNATTAYTGFSAGLWANSAAITSIKIIPYYGTNWQQYSTATLYGILKA